MGLGLWVLLVYAFLLLPVVVVVMAAFSATSYLSVPPKGLTLRWFLQVLGDPAYLSAIWYSLASRHWRQSARSSSEQPQHMGSLAGRYPEHS